MLLNILSLIPILSLPLGLQLLLTSLPDLQFLLGLGLFLGFKFVFAHCLFAKCLLAGLLLGFDLHHKLLLFLRVVFAVVGPLRASHKLHIHTHTLAHHRLTHF